MEAAADALDGAVGDGAEVPAAADAEGQVAAAAETRRNVDWEGRRPVAGVLRIVRVRGAGTDRGAVANKPGQDGSRRTRPRWTARRGVVAAL